MNNHKIAGLSNNITDDNDVVNRKFVIDSIHNIKNDNMKESHTLKNAFQYITDDVNEISSEYNVDGMKIADLKISPHYWNKNVVYLTPIKKNGGYRFRLGIQCFRLMISREYTMMIELYNRDSTTFNKTKIWINGVGINVENYNARKFTNQYSSGNWLYYTKTQVHFKKTSPSAPIFLYFTVHYEQQVGS